MVGMDLRVIWKLSAKHFGMSGAECEWRELDGVKEVVDHLGSVPPYLRAG